MALPEDRKERLRRLLLKVDSPEKRRAAIRVGIALAKARLKRREAAPQERPEHLCSVWMRNRMEEDAWLEMERLIERLRTPGTPRRSR